MGNIIVTGYKGFIGSRIMGKFEYAVGVDGDIRDKEKIRPYFKDSEFVIHAAAKKYDASQEDFYAVNVTGTQNVARLCMEYGCKMIHLSTIEEEGDYGITKQLAQKLVEEYKKEGLRAVILRMCSIYEKPSRRRYPVSKLMDDLKDIINNFDKYEEYIFLLKPRKILP